MDIDYTNYHRDSQYQENEVMFKNIFQNRFNLISKYIKNPKRVLDIGCSNGLFLSLFENSEKWGVEPSENAKKINAKYINIINTYFEEAKLPNNYFDLVIMNHTLEHVDDANLVLVKISKILKKNGVLFIDVPNAGGLGSKILGNYWPYRLHKEHNYQFTKESLSKILTNNNFKIIHWESRSGLFEFAHPWAEVWQSLVGLKKRFVFNVLTYPYSLLTTRFDMGDSMSYLSIKK